MNETVKSKHTEGPWSVQHLTERFGHHGYPDWHIYVIRSPQNVALAEVGHIDRYESERIPANARLMAASPDFAAALEAVAAFQFTPIAEDRGYAAALDALCALKRRCRVVLSAAKDT